MRTLYTETPQHKHACTTMKHKYSNLTHDADRCAFLAKVSSKAFDYEKTFEFRHLNGEWIASLWNRVYDARYAHILVAVDIENSLIQRACLEVVNNATPDKPIVISDFPGSSVSVPYNGIPLAALTKARVHIRVLCDTYPGKVVVRYRVLPEKARNFVARNPHKLTERLRVKSGKISVTKKVPLYKKIWKNLYGILKTQQTTPAVSL